MLLLLGVVDLELFDRGPDRRGLVGREDGAYEVATLSNQRDAPLVHLPISRHGQRSLGKGAIPT